MKKVVWLPGRIDRIAGCFFAVVLAVLAVIAAVSLNDSRSALDSIVRTGLVVALSILALVLFMENFKPRSQRNLRR
ncbi:MAG: hypothetical protein A2751_02100 [Candidatus Doudnabacteria bacterium RIFCSPHIGHO2_01_FULL_46_14]|uniref:Uncharacterized protein n=1 Tax=Candidatus Doudnabacteria bacterium RIFCSPHIGHO2_01_FULL_46_14 TaxID=1817824 RepID=A0A1F5NJM2_9BACT|nr:MAG: hypothetical protein A2751_02100 [Candidatus Doudnabacteria bacterium RIFCSPHIGHO2_01_FULL_46_14]